MPSGVSDAELVKTFRAIGEGRIQALILQHFREELGNPDLELHTTVFPELKSKKHIFLNQLAVRKCLYDNWPDIQDSYPCIHDFEYVVGDADCLFLMRFPCINLLTGRIHGVETVQNFIDFIFEFIQILCIPCLDETDRSCVVTRQRMKEALETCKTSECTETRTNLLNFFIDNTKSISSGASSATNLRYDGISTATPANPNQFGLTESNTQSFTPRKHVVARYEDDV